MKFSYILNRQSFKLEMHYKSNVHVNYMDTFWYIQKQLQFSHLVLQISKRILRFSLVLFITKSSRTTAVSLLKVSMRYFHSC